MTTSLERIMSHFLICQSREENNLSIIYMWTTQCMPFIPRFHCNTPARERSSFILCVCKNAYFIIRISRGSLILSFIVPAPNYYNAFHDNYVNPEKRTSLLLYSGQHSVCPSFRGSAVIPQPVEEVLPLYIMCVCKNAYSYRINHLSVEYGNIISLSCSW